MRFWKPKKIGAYPSTNRGTDHTPTVGIAVASYLNGDDGPRQAAALQCLVASFQAQTYQKWKMLITHDGPYKGRLRVVDEINQDPRIEFQETVERKQQFGHPHRQFAVQQLTRRLECEWVGLTNQDCYYVPVYLEWMLAAATAKKAPFVFCDCIHSHKMWKLVATQPRRGKLDLGGWLATRDLVNLVKFDNFSFSGDGDFINRLVAAAKNKVEKVPAVLYVHN